MLTGGEREADHPVEAVVVGDGQGGEPEPGGFVRQLLGVARAVEEREVGVAVQLRVGDHPVTVPNICSIVANADDDFCYLTTTGRVTGEPHEIEIWFAVDGDTALPALGCR